MWVAITNVFRKLALMCDRMFPEESDKIEKYVGGLPDMIHGIVMASKPKTMQDAIEFATELMDKKISTFAEQETIWRDSKTSMFPMQTITIEGMCAPKFATSLATRVGHLARDYRSLTNVNIANNQRGTGVGLKAICYESGAQGHF
ncbi:hypothetical protein Tco_1379139 [Tanacetum coccineum]